MRTRTRRPAPDEADESERRDRLIAVYQAERAPLVRLAHLMTGSAALAEDIVQDAFVRLHPVLDTVDRPGAYLRTTVVNLCHTYHRRQGVERRWLERQPGPATDLPPDLDETWRALAGLPETQRHALVLRFYLDLRIDDIAALLGIPAGTVKSSLHRGLAALGKEVSL
jgi:RNA polymerase sigma factor (sigma-70 family)